MTPSYIHITVEEPEMAPSPQQPHELVVEGDKVLERTESGTVLAEKDYDHVVRGYKAASHNKRFSHDTRESAEQMLHDLEAAHDAQAGEQGADTKESGSPTHSQAAASSSAHHTQHAFASDKAHEGETHEEEVHRHHKIGGLKANLHRDDRSEETKEHIRQQLRELGEKPDA
ncbi:hypothetical protein Rhopal_007018-T1 [Rhodotorula paludigena]|uniref:Uncharacterized protein n=1 Tax=Rhodotorula paludigena TaxID=86838 RepID=A0AAV5GUM6_9BASI|nr:hypothetical protein Rhopal_007018-T1 [Rhodotorula paludigena]